MEFESTNTTVPLPRFLMRVYSYPVINDACGQVADVYGKVRDFNRVTHAGFGLAETGFKKVTTTATPIISKFDNQITFIDDLTCKQLDKLEEKVPAVTKTTAEFSKAATGLLCNSVSPAVEAVGNAYTNVKGKVHSVEEFGKAQLQKVTDSPYGKFVLRKLNSTLDAAEQNLDYYLPESEKDATEHEILEDSCVPENQLAKAGHLTAKLKKRMLAKAMSQMHQVKMRSAEAIENMNFTVDLIAYAKTQLQPVADKITTIENDFKFKLWELETAEETKQEEEKLSTEEAPKSDKIRDRRLLHSLLYWSHKLNLSLQAGKTVFVDHLPIPETVRHSYTKATETATKLFHDVLSLKSGNYTQSIPSIRSSFNTIDLYLKSVFDYVDNVYRRLVSTKKSTKKSAESPSSSEDSTIQGEVPGDGSPSSSDNFESCNKVDDEGFEVQDNGDEDDEEEEEDDEDVQACVHE